MIKDIHVGKVVLVNLPNNSRPRYRWIVTKRDDGRYIARTPKLGILIRDLHKKIDNDYNSEHLLPKDVSFWKAKIQTKRRKVKKSNKNKTKRRKN
jgi:hypothetical protein